jgi:hypothetical protein
MTHEGIPAAAPDTEPAGTPEVLDARLFLAEHGLGDIADLVMEAHGETLSVADAVRDCPPVAALVASLSESLASLPDRNLIITKALMDAGSRSNMVQLPDDAKKKLN